MDSFAKIRELLDDPDTTTTGTSMRLPKSLVEAASLAVKELGLAPSATALTVEALRNWLEFVVMRQALDEHYREHPEVRPSLADVALAAAKIDGHPLAKRAGLIRRAAKEVAAAHPDVNDPDVVLIWAEALASVAA